MTDSGCATLGVGIGEHDENGAEPLDEHHRTYCLLFKGSLSRSVRDIMEKQWRKFEKCLRSSVRTSPGAQNTGWMYINSHGNLPTNVRSSRPNTEDWLKGIECATQDHTYGSQDRSFSCVQGQDIK